MVFTTIMALVYIHMQMNIFELAYKGKDKEKRIHELSDMNGAMTHQILTLQSANHLGNQLLEKDAALQFMGNDRVIRVVAPRVSSRQMPLPKTKAENPMWNLLSFLGAQEARAWEN